ncbi:protein NRT1/ PTR FAMILY 6.3-like [Triticum dicoccoides]|uniref:protein NRT1/ PTR FAMILY 6.3-like n=1 Tax=Triticum dicoccoides TaxID=85692 RepID=UPI001890AA23|nr:protein NRT1/ PTR FAMILY 6.3-like [Triticum dicoccoides]
MAPLPETTAEATLAAADDSGDSEALGDAWDYRGRPAVRGSSGGWSSAAMILGVELNERLTTLGIAVNLVTYLTATMHLGNAASANAVTNFLGTSFLLCLLGGFVADTYLGRYLTIAISTAVQAAGMTILTVSTAAPGLRPPPCKDPTGDGRVPGCAPPTGTQLGVLYLGLYLTALGTGGLKSSVSGFGSDQFDESHAGERRRMARFFGWFFFFISLGSLLAVTVLVYVQDNVGRRWGYGACVVAILAGLGVFLAGTPRYRFKKLAGSPLTQIAAVTAAAWRKRALPLPSDPSSLYDVDDAAAAGEDVGGKRKLPHSKQCRFLDQAAIVEVELEPSSPSSGKKKRKKWAVCTVTEVEEVKQVVRMLPTWATTIVFWTVYAQMTTFSVSQAQALDRRLGPSFVIPAGSLTVFFVGSILLTVPIYDRLIAPLARRLTGNPQGLSPLQRIFVGLFLSILAMAVAGLTERHRLSASTAGIQLSVFLIVPQFLLVGAGEAFTYIGQLDFFLRECPRDMKTMSTGLFLTTLSLGFFLSSGLVSVVHAVTTSGGRRPWLANDIDKGRLDYFYWLLAAISTANLGIFVVAAKGYVYKEKRLADAGFIELHVEEVAVHA